MGNAEDDAAVVVAFGGGAAIVADARLSVPARAISGWRQWYTVIVLTVLIIVASVDRTAITLVIDPIKADLKLTDTQLSLLLGLSFTVFNILTALPVGMLVDRFNRKYLLAIGLALWSCTTTLCGFAHNFWQLFLGRAGVGISEGGLGPASFSLIRDTIPPERRGRAFGIYGTGNFLGAAAAAFVGGTILAIAKNHESMALPLIGQVKTWQIVFIIVGLGSFPFLILLAPLVEPLRRAAAHANAKGEDNTGYLGALRYIAEHWRQYIPLTLFTTFFGMTTSGYLVWTAALIHRNYGLPLHQIALTLGVFTLIAPALGLFASGLIIDQLAKRGRLNGAAPVGLGMALLVAGPQVLAPLMPTVSAFWWMYGLVVLIASSVNPTTQVLLSRITPSRFAGKISALFGLNQVLGRTVGPLLIGLFSDHLFKGRLSLGYGVSLNALIFVVLTIPSAIWMALGLRNFKSPDDNLAPV